MIKKIGLFLLCFFVIERFCHWQTGGFQLGKMVLYPTTSPSKGLPLKFIGAGNQYYAFETLDHQYVYKFMKFSRRRPLPWLEHLPLPSFASAWRDHYLAERAKRLSNLYESRSIACNHLLQETALITDLPIPKAATLIDNLGIEHTIDFASTTFIVQKKATPFTTYFDLYPSLARPLIAAYIKTITAQCHKGICNLDPLLRNYGIADNQFVILDIGSLMFNPKLQCSGKAQQEVFLELLPLRQWLSTYHPEYLSYFDAHLKKSLAHDTITPKMEALCHVK